LNSDISSIQKPKISSVRIGNVLPFHEEAQKSTRKQKAARRRRNGELIDIPVIRNRQRTNSVQMSILSKQIDTTN
jgi:hypothetical protein